MHEKIKRIIISRTDSIGDVMLTLPMAGILKESYPNSKIIFLGKSYTKAIIDACEHVDEFLDWDKLEKQEDGKAKQILKNLNADVIIHVFPRKEIARLAKSAGIEIRIGTRGRVYHWLTCTKLVSLSRKNSDLHEAQLNVKLLKPLGINKEYSKEELPGYYGFNRIVKLPESLSSLIESKRFNLILHPLSQGNGREWGIENYLSLGELLPADRYKIFMTGSEKEGEKLRPFIKDHPKIHDLTGKMDLPQFISFIANVDGLVASGTGPLHVAAALGKKAVGIFPPIRPIHPGRWAPLGANASYLVKPVSCSDCRKTLNCKCMRDITEVQVMAELEKI